MSEERVQYDVQAAEDRLRALAEKATPGPWGTQECSNGGAIWVRGNDYRDQRLQVVPEEDATYIAACDPQTVLAILDALAAERKARLAAAAEAAGLRAALEGWDDGGLTVHWVPLDADKPDGVAVCESCGTGWGGEHYDHCITQRLRAALAAPPSPEVAEVQRLRAVGAAVKALFDGRNMAAFPNAPHCYVVDGEALDAVKAALGAGELA